MIKYITAKKRIKFEHSIVCDKCGKELDYDSPERFEFLQVKFQGGYFSAWGDGEIVECDLCSECSKELLEPFAKTHNSYDDNIAFAKGK